MKKISLVTGANGHLGNNLVRALAAQGETVRAGMRNLAKRHSLEGVKCEIVQADVLDKASMVRALQGVDTLYQVAAVFKHWAADPHREILLPNIMGTEYTLEAAALQGVNKVIHVSSITTLDRRQQHMDGTAWNLSPTDGYEASKVEAEKRALRIARELDLFMVRVLPAAMIGPQCIGHLTPSMEILQAIMDGRRPVDPSFHLPLVSVEDVARAMVAAGTHGQNGGRYILGCEKPVSTTDLFAIARTIDPGIKKPLRLPGPIIHALAHILSLVGTIKGREPDLSPEMVRLYHRDKHSLNLTDSIRDLGFAPEAPLAVARRTMEAMTRPTPITTEAP
ncbi:NAD-dependent epimerase/dehydratase family protein [Desulfogranum mediterraneum]|uniref:NAD-dependent epimerase/dehydratase family protein n=1 Tax=Desulfogranum mediterraneum TaxID=160661 RepID=UPI0004261D94|nr:NAD-dependent epimerase/dehydratase family protein [Desulfogranum mediterraneum]